MSRLRLGLAAVLTAALAACGDDPAGTPDAGGHSGADACERQCTGRSCGPDGCGGTCGTCTGGEICGAAGQCESTCTPEPEDDFCRRNGKNCGSFSAVDIHCGALRTVGCGSCATGTCTDNVCPTTCTESQAEFCARVGAQCGPASGLDRCGAQRSFDECGPCRGGQTCELGRCVGTCTPESDAEFCSSHGADCGSFSGKDVCGGDKTVADCGPCSSTQLCADHHCVTRPPPQNDLCAAPIALDFQGHTAVTVTGDTRGATDQSAGTCADTLPMDGGDVVFLLQLDEERAVRFAVETSDPAFDATFYVRTACESAAPADEVACSVGLDANLRRLAAGTYYVIVDGFQGTAGPFSLTVELSAPIAAPANDTCDSPPIALALDTPASGDTTEAVGDYGDVAAGFSPACGSAVGVATYDGGDLVYSYTPAADGTFYVVLEPSPLANGRNWDPAVWVTAPTCGAEAECLGFVDVGYGGEPEVLAVAGTANTTYFIVVDSFSPYEAGPFAIRLTSVAPAP